VAGLGTAEVLLALLVLLPCPEVDPEAGAPPAGEDDDPDELEPEDPEDPEDPEELEEPEDPEELLEAPPDGEDGALAQSLVKYWLVSWMEAPMAPPSCWATALTSVGDLEVMASWRV